jgi:16S rRNA (adenine1518-N6/adenine1519-N6)-dimethyltransferase
MTKKRVFQQPFKYKKRLGQNFLYQKNIILQIISKINPLPDDIVLEIGAGSGYLTQELAGKVKKLYAVEIDKEAFAILEEKFNGRDDITLINADFMELDICKLIPNPKSKMPNLKVIGNIPYYITTPIIEKLIENRDIIGKAYITVQKEMADRITAKESSKIYGSLSVFVQFYADAKTLLKINRGNFFPVPDVDSALIELDFSKKNKIQVKDDQLFFKIVHAGFSQRRKMLIKNLKRELGTGNWELEEAFKAIGIGEKARAEDISILNFAKLSDILYNKIS